MKFIMSCLWCKPRSETPPIIDVEKVIQDYVWRKVKGDRYPLARVFMRRCDYEIEVPHNYFHFEDVDESIEEDTKPSPKKPTTTTTSGGKVSKAIPEMSVLCTEFRNNTESEQTFQFRFQKTRSASVNVTFQKGFTIGGKAQFKLGLPKHLTDSSTGGEVNLKYQVTKTTGETFDESVTIEANSEIRVVKQRKYIAKVSLAERQFSGTFRVETLMRMPSGSAPIFVRRKRSQELFCIESISDLKSVFAGLPVEVEDVSTPSQREAKYAVKFVTTGVIEGVRLLGQKIYLDSQQLDDADSFTVSEGFITGPIRNKLAAVIEKQDDATDKRCDVTGKHADVMESSTESTSQESGQNAVKRQPETKILKDPEIPRIITTTPVCQKTSPESVHNVISTDPCHRTSHAREQNNGAQIPKIRLPKCSNIYETNVKPNNKSVTVITPSVKATESEFKCAPKAEPESLDAVDKNKDLKETRNEASEPKIQSGEYKISNTKVEPELSKTNITNPKRPDVNRQDVKQTTKSKFLLRQSARLDSKFQFDLKQMTKSENFSKDYVETESVVQQESRPKPVERQTSGSDVERKKMDVDSKRTRSLDVYQSRTLPDCETRERRLKGDQFMRHSLPISRGDDLRKAVLSEEKRRSLSKLTKCTSV